MNVHLFGSTSSPPVAAFVLLRTAEDNVTNAEAKIVETVRKTFMRMTCSRDYGATAEEALCLVSALCALLESEDFHLTKFVCNDKNVLKSFPTGKLTATVKMTDHELPTQKALGVNWNAETDRLGVRISICRRACTRRGLLSMIGQTFDPIGLLQPFLLLAKRMLQQACRAGLPWVESISVAGVGVAKWEDRLENLPKLESVSVTRSFKILGKRVKGD